MPLAITMPRLTQTMDEGRIIGWLKSEGDVVEKGESLVLIETDKAAVEVEAPASGVLSKIIVPEGDAVPVGQTIAVIAEAADAYSPPAAPAEVKISPRARRLAQEKGMDIMLLTGTGPVGRIVEEDVLRVIGAGERPSPPAPPPAPPGPVAPAPTQGGKVVPLAGMRKAIAEQMALSSRTVARVTITMEVDMTDAVELRGQLQPELEKVGVRLTHNDLIVKAVATALKEHPMLNSRWTEGGIELVPEVNVGVAVAMEEGLVVPVVHGADEKSLVEIARATTQLADKARQRRLSQDEFTGGTFTVTNLGMYDVEAFTPIVNPPEAAILGVGRIAERPSVLQGQIVVRSLMVLSLSFDHRIVDGALAARFLRRVKALLEAPAVLLL